MSIRLKLGKRIRGIRTLIPANFDLTPQGINQRFEITAANL